MIDPISARLEAQAGTHGTVMLMYHGIAPGSGRPSWPWQVSLQRFRAQLDLLQAGGWRSATMAELEGVPPPGPRRTVVITFDDGYQDNLAACDELQARGMRATWLVVSGSIGREPGWQDDGRPPGPLLDAVQLRRLHAAGMEIGSHTVTHRRLTDLAPAEVDAELADSRAMLADVLGASVRSFAYPYGAFSDRIVGAVRQAGYEFACTTRSGWALRDGDELRMRRLTVFNHDGAASLARKLYFGDNSVGWREVLRMLRRRLTNSLG